MESTLLGVGGRETVKDSVTGWSSRHQCQRLDRWCCQQTIGLLITSLVDRACSRLCG